MTINIREKQDVVILDCEGNLDINASNFIETIGWVLVNKSKNILCNFEGINLIDYLGISLIAVAYKNVLNHNGKMKLYNVPSHIVKLFSIVGLDRVFIYYENEEKAIQSFKEDERICKILNQQLRRRFKRLHYKGEIEYKQKYSPSPLFIKGKIINLSAVGAFIIGEKIFSVGELLTTRLYILPEPPILEIEAKVIWVADGEIQPIESPAMGIEFYNISTQTQEKIISFIERNLASSELNE